MKAFEPTLTFHDIQAIMIGWFQASKRWIEISHEGRIASYAEFVGILDDLARAYDALRLDASQPTHRKLRQALVKAEETREQIDAAQHRLTRAVALTALRNYSGQEQPLPEPEDGLLDTIERLVGFKPGNDHENLRELRRALAPLQPFGGRAVSLWSDGELSELVARAERAVFDQLGRPKENYIHQPRFYPYLNQLIFLIRDIVAAKGQPEGSRDRWH